MWSVGRRVCVRCAVVCRASCRECASRSVPACLFSSHNASFPSAHSLALHRYQQEERDRFGDAFGEARAHRRPEMLRRLD